ncbi:MAG TPA: NAD(P)/FAD-dependent oxidoreductase [Terrimicrobiaceae bacterium]
MAPETSPFFDVVVVGGGAAGMMCAFTAGRRGRRVALLEHNDRAGNKIAISGGGRCNFTNVEAGPENFLSKNRDFCRSALARYTPWDFIELVEKHGIAYHEKKLGQQFCNSSSRAIIAMLLDECRAANVQVRCNCRVTDLRKSDRFHVRTQAGSLACDSLVIATGGLSFARLGATDFGYRTAAQFGLRVTELRPGLVPLTFHDEERAHFQKLSGVAMPVVARAGSASFGEAMLFTHRGLSGPAILQVSSYLKDRESVFIDLLPQIKESRWLSTERAPDAAALLGRYLPRRFAEAWSKRYASAKPFSRYNPQELRDLDRLLHNWPVQFSGTEGYPKAEVTLGGVDTGELSSKTLESRNVRGLFFIGEVVDVTGWLGGYNFQWAWASGYAAGLVV